MTQRPIIFSSEMVRAILSNQKSQTRRIVKSLPEGTEKVWHDDGEWIIQNANGQCWTGSLKCPYGQPGDELWVREMWQPSVMGTEEPPGYIETIIYSADYSHRAWKHPKDYGSLGFHRRPSIHMPREAARLFLEITDVRAERLREISEEDAIAEGIEVTHTTNGVPSLFKNYLSGIPTTHPRSSFASLWDSINLNRAPWESNPWVWVITFKRKEE